MVRGDAVPGLRAADFLSTDQHPALQDNKANAALGSAASLLPSGLECKQKADYIACEQAGGASLGCYFL